ncbi:Choline transport protein [Lachnellula arida]|uniref:Choline transport protein n=1 Tax=Lachnellula arida TaxID=1316785 RepID=A0A8T9AZU5_9HELO|nr:Choline transport protein [Lachnellula arida]
MGSEEGEPRSKLKQHFSLVSLCAIAVTTGESWVVLGNSLAFAILNGGSTGVIYGFIVDTFCYCIVAASIAELASSMPTAGTVYHWALATGGRHGRICSWFAGFWNLFAWIVGTASLVSVMALQLIAIYAAFHPGVSIQNWHTFLAFVACCWCCCLIVAFGNKLLPIIESFGAFFILSGFAISIVVCVVYPHIRRKPYASNAFVWKEWENDTGWSSDGFAFCLGMLNAAFAVCAPDIPAHLAEEIPRPKHNVPIAIVAQYAVSFVTGLCYLVTIFYVTTDFATIAAANSAFPLALIYLEATGSHSATAGLLVLTFIPTFIGAIGAFTIASRTIWALSRDDVVPASNFFARLDASQAPRNATIFVGLATTALGCTFLNSARAFNAIVSSFVSILTSLSYLAAILPNLLGGRRGITPGPFWMPKWIGFAVNTFSCLYLIVFIVIFCFPATLPVSTENMNYASVIVSGFTLIAAVWWMVKRDTWMPELPEF